MINREECSSPRKNKILVVEDHFDIRKTLVLRLKELAYEVFEAETGLDAFRKAREISPDLILMDLGIRVVGGDEVISWLKTDLLTRHIPIIITTAILSAAVDRALATGAADVIHKPFNFDVLNTVLRRHLPARSVV
jgi:CheY-like chemotaxis protein